MDFLQPIITLLTNLSSAFYSFLLVTLSLLSTHNLQPLLHPQASSSSATDSASPPYDSENPMASSNFVPFVIPPSSKPPPPQPSSSPPSPSGPKYQLEADPDGQEGFYIMKNTGFETMATVTELNQAVNNYRYDHHLSALYIDPQLCDIATSRSQEIHTQFSHDAFAAHVSAGDYNYVGFSSIGENLWQGSFSAVHIVEFGWDRSPGHQANLKGDWTRGCAGIFDTNAVFVFAR